MKIFENEKMRAEFFMRGEEVKISEKIPHVMPSQVHGKNIITVNDENIFEFSLPKRPEADGIILKARNSQASLRFADCTPVLIYDEDFAMLLHSGYKGTVLNISSEGIKEIGHEYVKNFRAWIGPCIGRKYYCRNIENDEWTLKGLKSFHEENYDERGEKIYFDIAGEIKLQLMESGLKGENINLSGIDTFEDSRCYSYRRGDKTERMTLHVKIKI